MASRAMDLRARHLRLVRPTDRTPAQIAASQSRIVLVLIGSTAALQINRRGQTREVKVPILSTAATTRRRQG